jgi:hypothetical protein
VGLNVTRHFTIARTQQQLLIEIMTTKDHEWVLQNVISLY